MTKIKKVHTTYHITHHKQVHPAQSQALIGPGIDTEQGRRLSTCAAKAQVGQNPDMSERVIPLADHRTAGLKALLPARPVVPTGLLTDTLGRTLRDLRISVTDRCNFRCNYCMPKEVFDG